MLDLSSIAQEINLHHKKCQDAFRTSLEHGRACGELLVQVKAGLKHGQWLPWIKENCAFSERTARIYMQISNNWGIIQDKSATTADFGISDAIKLLKEGSSDDAIAAVPESEPSEENKHYLYMPTLWCPDMRDVIKAMIELGRAGHVAAARAMLHAHYEELYRRQQDEVECISKPWIIRHEFHSDL